jgi:hypothetical protein
LGYKNKDRELAIRYRCKNCNIVLSGEGASRHYLANPTHKLEKLPPPLKPVKNTEARQ